MLAGRIRGTPRHNALLELKEKCNVDMRGEFGSYSAHPLVKTLFSVDPGPLRSSEGSGLIHAPSLNICLHGYSVCSGL